MFSVYRNIQRNICNTLKRGMCNMKDDNVTLRLRHITNVLNNKDEEKAFYDNIHLNHKDLETYYDGLTKEKNEIFKKMLKDGRWNEYMGITGDFCSHTYY